MNFSSALEGSWLLRPWVSVAQADGARIRGWVERSVLGRLLPPLQNPVESAAPSNWRKFYGQLYLAGGLVLLVLLSFASTGIIGGLTWMLMLYGLLGWIVFRPPVLSRITAIDLIVLLFIASAAISAAFSSYVMTSIIGFGKMLTFFAGYVTFRVLAEQGRGTVITLLLALVAIGLGESLIGFYQHHNHIQPLATWTDPSINPELRMDRIFGTLQPSNPNLLAGFLTPCFAAATGLALALFSKKRWPLSILLIGTSLLILVALVLTGSRGGYLAVAVMLLVMFAYLGHLIWRDKVLSSYKILKPLWTFVLVASLVGAVAGVMSSEQLRARVVSIFAMREDSSISFRLNVYQSAQRMVKDNPVVGIGPGNNTFKLVYGLYMVPGYTALSAYSVPLEIAVEQGAVGLIIFMSLLLILALRTAFLMDASEESKIPLESKLLAGALLAGVLGSITYGFFDTIWYRPSVNLLFWMMVAALAVETEPAIRQLASRKTEA